MGLTTGKEVTSPLPNKELKVVGVEGWDGKEAVVVEEEEFSLEDIMGEEVRVGGWVGGFGVLSTSLSHSFVHPFIHPPTCLHSSERRLLQS